MPNDVMLVMMLIRGREASRHRKGVLGEMFLGYA